MVDVLLLHMHVHRTLDLFWISGPLVCYCSLMFHIVEITFSQDFVLQSPWTLKSWHLLTTLLPLLHSAVACLSLSPLCFFLFSQVSTLFIVSLYQPAVSYNPSVPRHVWLFSLSSNRTLLPLLPVLSFDTVPVHQYFVLTLEPSLSLLTHPFSLHTSAPCEVLPSAIFPQRTFTRTDSICVLTGRSQRCLSLQKHFKACSPANETPFYCPRSIRPRAIFPLMSFVSLFNCSTVCFSPPRHPSGEEARPCLSSTSCGEKRPYQMTAIGYRAWRSPPRCLSVTQRCLEMTPSASWRQRSRHTRAVEGHWG